MLRRHLIGITILGYILSLIQQIINNHHLQNIQDLTSWFYVSHFKKPTINHKCIQIIISPNYMDMKLLKMNDLVEQSKYLGIIQLYLKHQAHLIWQ